MVIKSFRTLNPPSCARIQANDIASKYQLCHFWTSKKVNLQAFLAHLSRRLIGELIVYQWSGVCRLSSTMLNHLLLRNRLADESQILC